MECPTWQGQGWTLPRALSNGCFAAAVQEVAMAVAMAGCLLASGGKHQLAGPTEVLRCSFVCSQFASLPTDWCTSLLMWDCHLERVTLP